MEEYNIKDIRALFTVLFQSFATYSLTLRENVALSKISEQQNDDKIRDCLNKSGISLEENKFLNRLDIYMTRNFDDKGVELSKGQWQKVALVRTYFKDAQIVILDEPSAALDPIAEDRIFEQLYLLGDKKSSITISHRLSNTMLADKILVLENGKITEEGSHKELLNKKGKYAYLFQLQAGKYI